MAQVQITKKGRKKWYPVAASEHFNKGIIGEILSYDAQTLIGRHLRINLSHLTGDMRNQNINVTFRIIQLVKDVAETEIAKYTLVNTFIKRIVRSSKDRIDDSFVVTSKDNVQLRIKPLYLTRNNTQHSVSTRIREKGCEEIKTMVSSQSASAFFTEVFMNKVQKTLRSNLSKIYPLQSVEIRSIEKLT